MHARQDAVQEHQRETSRLLRNLPSAAPAPALAGQQPPAARSAPSQSLAARALERLSSSHDAAVALRDAEPGAGEGALLASLFTSLDVSVPVPHAHLWFHALRRSL